MFENNLFFIGLGYLVGSIPSGLLISRLKGIVDIRQYGSGNIGATNVSRILGIHYFFIIFLLDAGKAYGLLWITHYFVHSAEIMYIVALALFFGNVCSLFLNGSGGKGVATTVGILAFFVPYIAGITVIIWAIILCLTRVAGYASTITMISIIAMVWYITHDMQLVGLFLSIASYVLWLHRNYVYDMVLPKKVS